MLTITDYLKYANLQMAAEAFIRNETTLVLAGSGQALKDALIDGNNRSLLFTETQATAFADQWEVIDQRANTATGFSGTLFKAIKDNAALGIKKDDLVVSFRSTEFIDDFARDNKGTNELELAEGGFALGQIADMEAWYAELLTKPNALTGNQPPLLGQTYSVTGYSLGGQVRSFVGDAASVILAGGIDKLPGTPALGNQYDVVGWEWPGGSRRWRHGDIRPEPANKNLWRNAA